MLAGTVRKQVIERDHSHGDHGDFHLNPDERERILQRPLREAAVLIPIVDRSDGATVILTQRSSRLAKHSGQVAFPGGAVDADDAGPLAAALRETEEEIGLSRTLPDPLGQLPDYVTGSGYRIRPIIAIVPPVFSLVPNPGEVDEVFEVPLAFLMNPANHHRGSRVWQGAERHFYEMPYGRHYIWGVTAGIIRLFYERVFA